jgi:hypothetical protein
MIQRTPVAESKSDAGADALLPKKGPGETHLSASEREYALKQSRVQQKPKGT